MPNTFSPDLQPLLYMPEKVTIYKDKAKYRQEEEYIAEGEGEYNIQEEGSNIVKPVKFGSNKATFK